MDGTGGNCSTATACYTYDAEGRRVERTTGGVTTYYAYDTASRVAAEVAGGNWTNGYVYFNGQLRAIYDNIANTTRFVHQDHLGSTRLLTNMSGCVVDNLDYLPFGELLSNSPACTGADTSHKFTGYERDSESGLDNAQARYYSSAHGSFMSPDPLAGDIGDPQSLNRYAYVRNNPLTLTDPTGMDPCIDGEGCGGCDFCFDFSYLWDPPPPPPPVYNPPNTGAEPNPPTGDPTGPFWQEGGPQIPITGNLYQILGLPNPPMLVFDATDNSSPFNGPSYSSAQVCAASALLNKGGQAALDLLGIIPGEGILLKSAQALGAFASAAIAVSQRDGNPTDAALAATGLGVTAVHVGHVVQATETAAKAVPVVGEVVSGIAAYRDIRGREGLIKYYDNCMAGKN